MAQSKKNQPYTSKLRGVAALLESTVATPSESNVSRLIPLEQIRQAHSQPRRYFDPTLQQQLEASITQHGILEPLLVRSIKTDVSTQAYELIAGERRFLAAKAVGLSEVPVIIRELTDREAVEIALVENLQRSQLNPLEETEGILQLLTLETNLTVEELISILYRMNNEAKGTTNQNVLVNPQVEQILGVFEALGRLSWESFVSSRLPLLKLPQEILETLRQGKIEYTKAVAIARIKDEQIRAEVLEEAIACSWSLKQIREKIKELTFQPHSTDIFTRCESILKRTKKVRKQFEGNARKQKQLNSLLDKLEKLIEENSK